MSLWLLDPFGGGAETGHIGAYGKKESHIALEAALEAKKHLERNGEKTIITRKNDEYISDDKRTVVIVSHNSKTIEELCDKVIWLHDGLIKDEGDPKIIMEKYETFMRSEG